MIRRLLMSLTLMLALSPSASCQFIEVDKDELPPPPTKSKEKQATVTPCISWIDVSKPVKGYMLCVHGLGLHKGTYEAFGKRMAALGWGVYAVDVRGFGSFQKMPGPAPRSVDFEGCLQDVKAALEYIHKQHPDASIFLVGESMGGGIALQAASRFPDMIDGVISSVPGAARYHAGADAMKVGLRMMAGPNREFDVTKIVVNRSTDNEELRAAWLNDSFGRFKLSPVELMQFQSFMNNNEKAARNITKTPVLMMSGTEDKLVKKEDQVDLLKNIPSPDKRQVYVVEAEHLILEEGQFKDDVVAMIDTWLSERTPSVVLSTSASASKNAAGK